MSGSKESAEATKIAEILLAATAIPDAQFPELGLPRYTTVDYYRMASHMLFRCKRCGNCCTTGDPIRLRPDDAAAIARHLKIPLNKVLKKYTAADPDGRRPSSSSTFCHASSMMPQPMAARSMRPGRGPAAYFHSWGYTEMRTRWWSTSPALDRWRL